MSKLNLILFRMIKNSKGQFFAVVTIIIAGISVFIAMNMTSVNMANTLKDYYENYHFADLFVGVESIPAQKVADLARMSEIEKAQGRMILEGPLITENKKERVNVRVLTVNPTRQSLNECYLISGKPIGENSQDAWVLNQFAQGRGIEVGDKLKIQVMGKPYTLRVAGIVANPEFIYLMENAQSIMPAADKFGVVYVSENFGWRMSGNPGNYNDVIFSYAAVGDEEEFIRKLENRLDHYGLQHITKRQDQMSHSITQEELNQLKRISDSIPIVFLSVSALILMMMLGRMVKKDRIKIGILKAIGYTNREILFHYVKYAVAAGALGGGVGAVCGMVLSGAMTKLYLQFFNIPLLRMGFYPEVVIGALLATGAFCTLSGIIGARGVLRILPADSMQSEAPKAGKRILLERAAFFWKRLSFSWKMVWRNAFRNKKRTGFVLFGVGITYAMMLFTTSMPGAIDDLMNKHYQEFQRMDYDIKFQNPVTHSAIHDLRHLVDVEYMEGKLEYPFELENGNRRKGVVIVGLNPDTEFYSFTDIRGQEIGLPKSGVLLSENLADALKVKEGDTIKINTFIPGKENVGTEVRGVVKQALGINAYMDLDYMGKKLMERGIINGIYLNSKDENINEELIAVPEIASIMSVKDSRAAYMEYMSMMFVSIFFMVIFSGILGFCIVYNATIISIGERELEFASLRVLGLGKDEIFRMIVNENGIVMILGILAGIPMGIGLLSSMSASFTTDIYTIVLRPNFFALTGAAAFTIFFVLIAQWATYRKIQKLDLLQALKNRTS